MRCLCSEGLCVQVGKVLGRTASLSGWVPIPELPLSEDCGSLPGAHKSLGFRVVPTPTHPPGAGTARSVLVARLREVGHCRRPVAFSRDEEVFPREGAALSAGRLRYMNHHLKMARRLVTSGGMAP